MPPAPNQLAPDSLRSQLRVWLTLHPGWHTTRQIADGLGVTDPAARTALIVALSRLARAGDGVTSYRDPNLPARGPGTVYARAGTDAPTLS